MEEMPRLGFPLSKGVKLATKISHCNPFMCRVQWHYVYSHFGTTLPTIYLQNGFIFLTEMRIISLPYGRWNTMLTSWWGMTQLRGGNQWCGRGWGVAETLSFGKRGQTLPLGSWTIHPSYQKEGKVKYGGCQVREHCGGSLWKFSPGCGTFSVRQETGHQWKYGGGVVLSQRRRSEWSSHPGK